jgi:Tfp pilus assembly protein PilN
MTVVEEQTQITPATPAHSTRRATSEQWLRYLAFGTAVGIEIGERDIHAAIVRARPSGAIVAATLRIADFRTRPPKEWGSDYHQWLKQHGEKHLVTTVILPRREIIVRQAAMPGVTKKDLPSAVSYQIDSLHPYGDEEVGYGWSPAGTGSVAVGVIREGSLEKYIQLFQDAGVPVAGFTFSASAIYAALRLYGPPPTEFAAWREDESGAVEIYGESPARSFFSAGFDVPVSRALFLSRAELRLPAENARTLASVLPQSRNVATVSPLAYAAGLAAIGSWRTPYANLLPAEKRTVRSRARWVPTIVLGLALLAAGSALFAYQQIRQQRYIAELSAQIAKVQPLAMRADALDRRTAEHRQRIRLLDLYRKRPQGDIDVLAELSRLLPPPVWTQSIDINEDTVTIAGEADQAAPLLKILDSSPLFQNSEPQMGFMKTQQTETFRIRIQRRPRK